MNMKYKHLYQLIILIFLLQGCVGTVDDKNAKSGSIVTAGTTTPISFGGLIKANPISHDKVELSFIPAAGNQANYIYEIYINGSPISNKISGNALTVNSSGLMTVTVRNLSINTTYSFNMKAIESGTSATSNLDPSKSINAKTFSNETADFNGISSVKLAAGDAGKTTAVVSWIPATTKGTTFSPKATDPVAYEVTYISQLGGIANINNKDIASPIRTVIQSPTTLTSTPSLSSQTAMTINGLTPNTTYYFQVRAIHKNYALFGNDNNYRKELNTSYLPIKTLATSGVFDFPVSQVLLTNPIGEVGLSNLNATWLPATGSFDSYKVCYRKIADPNIAPELVDNTDQLIDSSSFDTSTCISKSAEDNFHLLTSLESYAYYQVKIVACRTTTCAFGDRIFSDLMMKRVVTNVSPFTGIDTFENPKSESFLRNISLFFTPPVTTAGYLNEMRLYCYDGLTDTSPVRIDNLAFPTSGTGKNICNGITVVSSIPTTLSEFASFNQVELELPANGIDGIKQYCFSYVPTIYSPYLLQSSVGTAVVKCITPQILTPNIVQFPGRNEVCNVVGKDLQVTWPIPTGGLYSKFIVFYQEKITGAEMFSFDQAIAEYKSNTPNNYRWFDDIDKALMLQNLTGLTSGSKYNIAVIPYLIDGMNKNDWKWGQPNLAVGECSLPLPKAKFNEWMNVLAAGPKEDGLTPVNQLGNFKYILETLTDDSIPNEIALTTGSSTAPDIADLVAQNRLGNQNFDGIYGRLDSADINPLHQYSNSGIISLSWEDVSLFGNPVDILSNYSDSPPQKNNRKYGYKVFRSDDNKLSWKELTSKTITTNTYQSANNGGLVQATNFTWRKRSNSLDIVTKMVKFTDYSVKAIAPNGTIDRGRVYYYKIVPVFNGREIVYEDALNPSHHIIKVILPPKNMSLVNRLMANRTTCYEMNFPIKKGAAQYYSCDYDGVGSTSLEPPYSTGNTVFDYGGDLLIDRFELGAQFTRGDSSAVNSNSETSSDKLSFTGFANNGNKYRGCHNDGSGRYEPSNGTKLVTGSYDYANTIPGDCFGVDAPVIASGHSTACSSPTQTSGQSYIYPGANGYDLLQDCTDPNNAGKKFTNASDSSALINTDNGFAPTRGEFASVYFIRRDLALDINSESETLYNYPAGFNKYIKADINNRLSQTYVNLPYLDTNNFHVSRWLPINRLFGNISLENLGNNFSNGNKLTLYNKTVNEILSGPLYDSTNVKAPGSTLTDSYRYNKASTPIARIFSSNAAKLPPLTGLTYKMFNNVCSTYKIQVGVETNLQPFKSIYGSNILEKRILRKIDSTLAGAWPPHWDNTKVNAIENGSDASSKGCNGVTKAATPTGLNSLVINTPISTSFPMRNYSDPTVLTGSSKANSTESCTSRFGVQDLAGNVSEHNSDELFCYFLSNSPGAPKPFFAVGTSNNMNASAAYNSAFAYDPAVNVWVSGFPDSGTCSTVEIGGARTGTYQSAGVINSIYLPDSKVIDPMVVTNPKSIDQDSVNFVRNGDGAFLDFGTVHLGPVLNSVDAFNKANFYFNVPLGIPLACGSSSSCSIGSGGDNRRIASDYHANLVGSTYDATYTSITNFPIHNSTFTNYGVEDFSSYGSVDTNDENSMPLSYVSGVNTASGFYATNNLTTTSISSSTPSPGVLRTYFFQVDRNSAMTFRTGGSSTTNPGRYTFFLDGDNEYDGRYSFNVGSRCAIFISE